MIGGIIGDGATDQTISDALHLNPENASTIANHGMQLLRQGKVNEALDRLSYALSLDPTNNLARYAMGEAMKNKFWPYKMFFKYGQFAAKLSGKSSWTFIIGAYIVYQILNWLADKNEILRPFLTPVIYIILGLFLLTWVMDPLMNLYLLSNKYGRLLLDADDKKMAKLCGVSLSVAIISLALHFYLGTPPFLMCALAFGLFLIPLGTFLKPNRNSNRKMTKALTIGIVSVGALGAVLNIELLLIVSFIGIFGYQWLINGIMIKENARVFGD